MKRCSSQHTQTAQNTRLGTALRVVNNGGRACCLTKHVVIKTRLCKPWDARCHSAACVRVSLSRQAEQATQERRVLSMSHRVGKWGAVKKNLSPLTMWEPLFDVPFQPQGRSPAPALRRGERWGRRAPCGGALGRFPALLFTARLTALLRAAALRACRRWRNARTRRQVRPAILVVTSLGERRAARGSARCRGSRRGAKKSLFAPDARWLVSTDLALLPALPTWPA